MANIEGRIRAARLDLMLAAAARWAGRAPIRESGLQKVQDQGIGAADTPKRQMEWTARQAARAAMPSFTERIIGTRDLVPYAPSVQASSVARPVARIVIMPGGGRLATGVATGFLITPELLLTNYHVFPSRSDALGYGANFRHVQEERGVADGNYFELDPDRFFLSDEGFDFAVVAVKPLGLQGEKLAECGAVRLIEATGKVLTGMPINIIQHPGGGPRQFAFKNNQLVDILPAGFLHYETDTEQGSSGSPVYNTDWELVALHHAGIPAMRDGAVLDIDNKPWDRGHDDESRIKWVANEGTRVSFIVTRLRELRMNNPAQQALLDALVADTVDPVAPVAATPVTTIVTTTLAGASGAAAPQERISTDSTKVAMANNTFNISGAVTMHFYAGAAPAAGPVVAANDAVVTLARPDTGFVEKKLVFDADYAERPGYDAKFLGVEIPLPGVTPARAAELYTVGHYRQYYEDYRDIPKVDVAGRADGDAMVLDYRHYSLATNAKYRMCMWTASNYDYRDIMRQDTRKRSDLGGENWAYDPRVPYELQLGEADIYAPARRIDRGHIVRREDNCWGKAGLATDYANSDTYHYTNCTPQHEAFNQENPSDKSGQGVYTGLGLKGIWGRFEGELTKQVTAGGQQAVLFAGPVLADFFRAEDWGTGRVSVPKKFWKVVVTRDSRARNARLLAYGYVFDQSAVVRQFGMTYEALQLDEFARQRKTLAEITALSGVTFAQVVLDAEQP